MKRPVLPMTGGCQCGAVRYEISGFPLLLYTCNCTDCQRQSGSAFALNLPVALKDYRILRGEPQGWHHLSPTGSQVISRFCGKCATRLYGERAGRPQTINVRGVRSTTHRGWSRRRIFSCAARSPGYGRRRMRSASRPSRTVGGRYCRPGARCGRSFSPGPSSVFWNRIPA